ncbi:DNA polymerase III subunit beta [Citrobacter freundii]
MTDASTIDAVQPKARRLSFKELPGFDISAEALLKIIEMPCMVIRRSPAMKVLEMITLRLRGDCLSALGIDLNSAQITSKGTVSGGNGDMDVSVPATQLFSLIRNMRGEDEINVRFHAAKNHLVIRTDKNSYNIPVCLDHIPEIQAETLEHNYSVYFPTQMLSQIIKRVSHAAAQNDVRFYMNGVYLGIDNGQFIAVATDGHRMAVSFHDIDFSDDVGDEIQSPTAPTSISNTNAGVILPNGVFPVLHKILSGSQGQFKIDYSNRNLTFTLGSHTVISNLVDGRYPDWKRVASTVAKNTELFKVDPSELTTALKRATPLLKEGSPNNTSVCVMSFKDNALQLKSPGSNAISCKEVMDIAKEAGEPETIVDIGMNADYLLESLASLGACSEEGEAAQIALRDTTTGILISVNKNNYDIIMPVRV